MRLIQDKIHDLATQIVDMIRDHQKSHLQAPEDAVRVAVGSAILDDLREEEDIEREADALIAEHSREMEKADMDVHTMRQKFKQQTAKQRGFQL